MQRVMLKPKIHRATVSDCDLHSVTRETNQIIDIDSEVATLLS